MAEKYPNGRPRGLHASRRVAGPERPIWARAGSTHFIRPRLLPDAWRFPCFAAGILRHHLLGLETGAFDTIVRVTDISGHHARCRGRPCRFRHRPRQPVTEARRHRTVARGQDRVHHRAGARAVAGGRLPAFAACARGRITRGYWSRSPATACPASPTRSTWSRCSPRDRRSGPRAPAARSASCASPSSTRRPRRCGDALATTHGGEVLIDIVDYPGEWLLDLPLLTHVVCRVDAPGGRWTRGAPVRPAAQVATRLLSLA